MSYPGKYKIKARQGQTLTRNWTWSVEDDPVNLTGFTARMQVRTSPDSDDVVLDAGPFISLGGTLGTVNLSVPAGTIAAISQGRYLYDLELDNGGTVTTLLAGVFQVDPEITR
jgi:hypothetical protein